MVRPILLACFLVALLGCSETGYSVSVDVRSDLVVGEDVIEIRTILTDAVGTTFPATEPIGVGDDLVEGVRAAEFDGLPAGDYEVEVILRNTAPESVLRRRSLIVLRDDLSLTIVLSSACVGVSCPGTGDAPDATECDVGLCVPPECIGDCSDPPVPVCEAQPETCNGEDDDCDGTIDEGIDGIETCNGEDDDCDGTVDEEIDGIEECNGEDDDCDGAVDETLTRACSTACGMGAETCAEGAWMACSAPPVVAETCNLVDDDCDGVCDPNGIGCRHPIHRSQLVASGHHFYSPNATQIMGPAHTAQTYNNYYLYTNPAPGLVPFYRCAMARIYTQRADCGGIGTVVDIIGYIAGGPVCGSVPMYRVHLMGDFYYTTDPAEVASFMAMGYNGGGIAGYVWLTP